jgi:hypothetical protein
VHRHASKHTQFLWPAYPIYGSPSITYIQTLRMHAHVQTSVIAHSTLFMSFWINLSLSLSLRHTHTHTHTSVYVFPCKFTHALRRHKYISYACVCACCSVLCGYHFDSIHWALMCTQQSNFTPFMCFWNKCRINQLSRFISAGWIYYCIIYSLSFATHILWVDRWLLANRILYF